MPGLDPGIHDLSGLTSDKDVDGRNKSGHDGGSEYGMCRAKGAISSLRAKRSNPVRPRGPDCFVAELVIGPATSGRTRWLLAMTSVLTTMDKENHERSHPTDQTRRLIERRVGF